MLLGYLQASIANMQDHRQPSLTILDFGLEEGFICSPPLLVPLPMIYSFLP